MGSIISENVYHTYSYTTTAISCASNALLIYVLLMTNTTNVQVGPYRYLLLIFAVVDVLISLVHLLLIPAIHMTSFGYIYWGYRFVDKNTIIGVAAGLVWVLLFYQTFVLLAFHYVYRYVKLCNPHWLDWIRQSPWRNWLGLIVIADVVVVGGIILACFLGFVPTEISRREFAPILKSVYKIDLHAPNAPGYLGIVFWVVDDRGEKQWIPLALVAIGMIIAVFFATAVVIIACTVLIVRELREGRFATLAPATKKLQRQLFKTLLVQTIIPCITSYTPLAMVFLVPLTGVALEGFGTVCIMSTALFPMLDPYIVIFLISGYRKRLFLALWKVVVKARTPPKSIAQISS